jgi:hypothetical protein
LDRISNLLQQSHIAIQTPDETLEAIIEPADIFTGDMPVDRVFAVVMAPVGIDPDWQDRYPREFLTGCASASPSPASPVMEWQRVGSSQAKGSRVHKAIAQGMFSERLFRQ